MFWQVCIFLGSFQSARIDYCNLDLLFFSFFYFLVVVFTFSILSHSLNTLNGTICLRFVDAFVHDLTNFFSVAVFDSWRWIESKLDNVMRKVVLIRMRNAWLCFVVISLLLISILYYCDVAIYTPLILLTSLAFWGSYCQMTNAALGILCVLMTNHSIYLFHLGPNIYCRYFFCFF